MARSEGHQPHAVVERASEHHPHAGQDKQQTTEPADQGKSGALLPPVGPPPSSSHRASTAAPSRRLGPGVP
jgi:hypothetical protein